MTFPLGSLRADGGASTAATTASTARDGTRAAPPPAHRPAARAQFRLLVGAVLWLLALLALATHDAADPAFSTSGSGGPCSTRPAQLGAWFSDFAFFLFGYSVWWVLVVGARAWLGALARVLRSDRTAPPQPADRRRPGLFWLGLVLLLAASASLEWTRLYQCEGRAAGGHAGGVLGYALGPPSMKLLGFAGSGVFWIAALVAGIALALRFSWLRLAERDRRGLESLRERRDERIERAEDVRLGEQALRERERVVEVERQAARRPPADRDRGAGGRGAEVRARRQGAAEAAVQASWPTPSCRRSTCSTPRPAASRRVDARDRWR